MLADRLDASLPPVIAWNQYLRDRDRDHLLAAIGNEADPKEALGFLLWLGIGAEDWELVKCLRDRNVDLPRDDDYWGLVAQAVDDFGDAPRVIEWLLDHGARLDLRNANDWSVLHRASAFGYVGVVKVLVERGAEVNDATNVDGGWTPLMEACMHGHKEIVEHLLLQGADPDVWNTYQFGKARDIAARHGHRDIAAMLDAWCDAEAVNKRKRKAWKEKRREK